MEKLETLIGSLCTGTFLAQADFQDGHGYSFSSYNTDFFAVWETSGSYRFSWSERHPSARFTMETRSDVMASYMLITELGARRRASLWFPPIVIPGEAPSDQRWKISETRWPRVTRYTSTTDPTMSVEATNSLELRRLLFSTRFPDEDYLESYMYPDAYPLLHPYLSSITPYLQHLHDAGVVLPEQPGYYSFSGTLTL